MDPPHLVTFIGLFAELDDTQKIQLKICFEDFMRDNMLAPVVRGTARFALDIELFPCHKNVSFWSCLNIAKFIAAFLYNQANYRIPSSRNGKKFREILSQVVTQVTFNEIRTEVTQVTFNEIRTELLRIKDDIREVTQISPLPINFRDDFAAIYHYCKHSFEGSNKAEYLAVDAYYDMIREVINRANGSNLYEQMMKRDTTKDLIISVYLGNDETFSETKPSNEWKNVTYKKKRRGERRQLVTCVLGLRKGETHVKTAYRNFFIPPDGYHEGCGWIKVNKDKTKHFICPSALHKHGADDLPNM